MNAAAAGPANTLASAPGRVAIRCRGVVKRYGAGETLVTALRGVDLDVEQGELLLLVGPSGCGKTTLISVIAGILDHDEGEVSVLGADLSAFTKSRLTRWRGEHVGFVFQAFNLIPTLTATENVAIPLLLLGRPSKEAHKRAAELLGDVGLSHRRRSLPRQLSGGEQQRVAIARSIVHDPKLVVCDEPTSSLDAETGRGVMELLRERAVSGDRALVIVTHDNRIFSFGDRIARMEDGRIIRVGPVGPEGRAGPVGSEGRVGPAGPASEEER